MKKTFVFLFLIAALAAGWFALDRYRVGRSAAGEPLTEAVRRDRLRITVEADGTVRSNQTAELIWRISGRVGQVNISVGDKVPAGKDLANLKQTSLPQSMILAQAELVEAQRALDDLRSSQLQRAQAQQAMEQARQALEDTRNPQLVQAEAQTSVAEAQKAVDVARRDLEIISKLAPRAAIEQARANLLIAERVLNDTLRNIERINKKLKKPEEDYLFFESRDLYKQILDALENKRMRDQRQYDEALDKYNSLLEPPDPLDLAIAQGNLALKDAELRQAQVEAGRVRDGATPGDLAVLEASLRDAERQWLRVKDGPDAGEVAAAEARLAAAQAALEQAHITAPFNGTITAVYTKPGDQVNTGDPAFRLDDLSRLLVDAQVSEMNINQIQVGQPVLLTFESVPDQEYHGQVVEVPAVGLTTQNVLSFKVMVAIDDADARVRPGMTSSVAFVVDDLDDALLVPNRALRFTQGERVVYVLRDGSLVPVPIQLGAASATHTQVLGGELSEGDQVVLDPSSQGGS